MEFIQITHENLETENICCAIASNKNCQVLSKKSWLKDRLDEGLVFLKGNVRGKCFIEYIPAEYAWAPIDAKNYMYIDCLWVAGQFKGNGYSNLLLDECIKDSKTKGKDGIVVLSSVKKMPFLSDPKYLKYKEFKVADTLNPYFVLMYLPFNKNSVKPQFNKNIKDTDKNDLQNGFTLFYTYQCPYNAKYVPRLEEIAQKRKVNFKAVQITTREQAQNLASPFTTFSLFLNGEFLTHEMLSEKKFEKLLDERGF